MKIGIITFHWAFNYGAVIQAWALQKFLTKLGHDAYIIDYNRRYPRFPIIVYYRKPPQARRASTFFTKFVRENLKLTPNRYRSPETLKKAKLGFDVYICGSDQVWNFDYSMMPDGEMDDTCFLAFTEKEARRVAYAASMGNTKVADDRRSAGVQRLLERFSAISVREDCALENMIQLGVNDAVVVPDPTILLCREDYLALIRTEPKECPKPYIFGYVLAEQARCLRALKSLSSSASLRVVNLRLLNTRNKSEACEWKDMNLVLASPAQWIQEIAYAKGVVTDSFHGAVLSVIFNKPFVALAKKGNNIRMNERLVTLLRQVGLEDQILWGDDMLVVPRMLDRDIDWTRVNEKLSDWRRVGITFLRDVLR